MCRLSMRNPSQSSCGGVAASRHRRPRPKDRPRLCPVAPDRRGALCRARNRAQQCTGDAARRAGNEFLFNELATANVEILNEVAPKRIVTTCPHCLHTLKNEYPAFGGNYTVIHHTQLINELVAAGRLKLSKPAHRSGSLTTISCYLGRHNQILADPRQALRSAGADLVELPRHGLRSFCCGAGGAQMWKEEEPGSQRISANRFAEVQATGVSTLAVACPFCMIMLTDARQTADSAIQLLDIAEVVLQAIDQ